MEDCASLEREVGRQRETGSRICQSQDGETKPGFGNLSQDLVVEILHWIPFKLLTKFKCVSKAWCLIITEIGHRKPLATSSGLFLLKYKKDPDHEGTLLTVKDEGGEFTTHSSNSLPVDCIPDAVASCNGLVLYVTRRVNVARFILSSPVHQRQKFELPPIWNPMCFPAFGIAFDGLQPQFKVVCCCVHNDCPVNGTISCYVYSSETFRWRNFHARVVNASFLDEAMKSPCWLPPHFLSGAIHWIWGDFMLVYYLDKKISKLVQLPTSCGSQVWRRMLWGSAKCLFHCCSSDSGIYIWTYTGGGGGGGGGGDRNNWELKHSVLAHDLVDKNPKVFMDMEWNPHRYVHLFGEPTVFVQLLPVAFNEDFRILYLQSHRRVVSYNTITGEIKVVWHHDDEDEMLFHYELFPFQFNPCILDKAWMQFRRVH